MAILESGRERIEFLGPPPRAEYFFFSPIPRPGAVDSWHVRTCVQVQVHLTLKGDPSLGPTFPPVVLK